jgi:predicted secreted Zn-dependent protease
MAHTQIDVLRRLVLLQTIDLGLLGSYIGLARAIHTTGYTLGWPEPFIYGVYTAFLAGAPPETRLYTVCTQGSGQP